MLVAKQGIDFRRVVRHGHQGRCDRRIALCIGCFVSDFVVVDAIAYGEKKVLQRQFLLCLFAKVLARKQGLAKGANGNNTKQQGKEYDFFQNHKAEQDSLVKAGRHEWNIEDYLFAKYRDEADATRPPLSMVIQHIEYIINLVGVDYVGLGSDFDGITNTPQQLDDVTAYPFITKALVEKGYSKKDIAKILGGNFLRVLKANEAK